MPFNRQTNLLWVGLVALAATFIAVQPRTPTRDDTSKTGKKTPETASATLGQNDTGSWPGGGPLDPIRRFLLPDEPFRSTAGAQKGFPFEVKSLQVSGGNLGMTFAPLKLPADPYKWPDDKDLKGYSIRFLIATVPDPMDSGLGFLFDQTLAAMQRALEMEGYVIDRAWLPWKPPSAEAAKSGLDARLQDQYPGLVLFRRGRREESEKRSLLAVLLVGETPTAGIHKRAFLNAVQIIQRCPPETVLEPERERLRVVGPYFSGSSMSLRAVLERTRQDWTATPNAEGKKNHERKKKALFIKVVCGSANGFDVRKFKLGWADADPEAHERAFETTVLSEGLLRKWVSKYLDQPTDPKRGQQPNPLVILCESNTVFGRSASLGKTKQSARTDHGNRVIMVPFPMHISQLRANYTKEQQARLDSLGLPRASRNLPFPQEEGTDWGKGHEGLPAQAPLMTGAMNDLVLTSIVDTIAEKRARHVGLIATDVRDKIFLASLIRERFPDVQLFTTGGDIFLTHPDYTYALKGMIVGSCYPLHPLSQGWSAYDGSEKQRVLFPNQSSQGYYNAILAQFPEDSPPGRMMMDYGWAEEEQTKRAGQLISTPPIWISMVGQNNQMIPLYCISDKMIRAAGITAEPPQKEEATYDKEEEAYGAVFRRQPLSSEDSGQMQRDPDKKQFGPQIGAVVFPNMWFLLFLAILVPGGLIFRYAQKCVHRSCWDGQAEGDRMSSYQQVADFALLCIPTVIFLGTVASLSLIPIQHPRGVNGAYVAACLVLVLSGFALAAVLGFLTDMYFVSVSSPFRRWGWGNFSGWGKAIPITALGMFLAVLGCTVCFVIHLGRLLMSTVPAWDVLWFERRVHLANGATPLLPQFFVCAALFAWGVFRVKKLYLANQFTIYSPFPAVDAQPFKDLNKLDGEIRSEIMRQNVLRRHPVLGGTAVAVLVVGFGKLLHEAASPVDGIWFIWVGLALIFVGSLMVLSTLVQFYLAWRKLKLLLRFMALLPMADAFDRLPDKVVAIFGHYLSGERPRHSHLAVCVQQYGPLQARFQDFFSYVGSLSKGSSPVGDLQLSDLSQLHRALKKAFPSKQMDPLANIFEVELNTLRESHYEATSSTGKTSGSINAMSQGCFQVLRTLWPTHSMTEAFGQPHPAEPKAATAKTFLSLPEGNLIREWALRAEDFVAIEVIRYVSQFFVQMRSLVTPLTIGSLLLVLAAASYPFVPQNLLLIFLTALGGVVAAAMVVFLIQINRDELVSRIRRSTPNQFTPDFAFIQGTATYVLPIVGALLVQFPFFTSALKSLLEPLFHIIK